MIWNMKGILFVVVLHLALHVVLPLSILQLMCTKNGVVCGTNGNNYRDGCKAQQKGVRILHEGKCTCKEQCLRKTEEPVCCLETGEFYYNFCSAKCDNLNEKNCIPSASPVCGDDGLNYLNECLVKRAGVDVACRKECPCSLCMCTDEYIPVCGDDGKTYGNACLPQCTGVTILCNQVCPCPNLY